MDEYYLCPNETPGYSSCPAQIPGCTRGDVMDSESAGAWWSVSRLGRDQNAWRYTFNPNRRVEESGGEVEITAES